MPHPPVLRLALLALVLSPLACATPEVTGPGAGPALVTDSLAYRARMEHGEYRLEIGYTYFNRTGARVYLPACRGLHPPELERWKEGEWVVAHSPLILLCPGEPVAIPAGGSLRHAYQLPHGLQAQQAGEPLEGRYRLVWRVYDSWRPDRNGMPGEPLPLEHRVSNEFRIER